VLYGVLRELGEVNMQNDITAIKSELDALTKIIVSTVPVEQIYLFGSYAYGTPHKDSDYDFYVVLKDDFVEKPIVAMQMIERDLFKFDTPKAIDVLANYKSRFEYRSTQPTLERKVATEGVLLHG
jgi:predicted nucleotidyltransferase